MTNNKFAVNTAAVNGINILGVPFVYPTAPVVVFSCSWRQSRAESLIKRDGEPGFLRSLVNDDNVPIIIAIKETKAIAGGTPQQYRRRRGFIAHCALARQGFTGAIVRGDAIDTDETVWHVDAAHLQKVAGEKIRWVLDLAESG